MWKKLQSILTSPLNPLTNKTIETIFLIFIYYLFYLTEIQAAEATKWLREAGFPQYAQMYQGIIHLMFITITITLWRKKKPWMHFIEKLNECSYGRVQALNIYAQFLFCAV